MGNESDKDVQDDEREEIKDETHELEDSEQDEEDEEEVEDEWLIMILLLGNARNKSLDCVDTIRGQSIVNSPLSTY